MSDRANLDGLGEALSAAVDRYVRNHPETTPLDVCGALGLVAGLVVANNIPAGKPECDDLAGYAVGLRFSEALTIFRRLRAN